MESLFTTLTEALYGSLSLAFFASFVWGVLSILLSPCHLSSIPLIIGYLTSQPNQTQKRALVLSTIFALGILITIAIIGAITAAAGRLMGDIGTAGNYIVAVVFFIVGLWLLDIVKLPDLGFQLYPTNRSGILVTLSLGLIFGIALGPCTFAFMAPVLGIVFQTSGQHPVEAALILSAFGLGHCTVIASAGTLAARVQIILNWNEQSKTALWIKRIAGIFVLLGGAYNVYLTF